MYFTLSVEELINYLQTNLLACSLLLVVLLVYGHQLYFYLRYIRKGAKTTSFQQIEQQPGVSVIVCAHNEENNLRDYLHSLLAQDYPCFEVIVVDDGSEDETQRVLKVHLRNFAYRTPFSPFPIVYAGAAQKFPKILTAQCFSDTMQ